MRSTACLLVWLSLTSFLFAQETIPSAKIAALDGHVVTLPDDFTKGPTVLIFGFTRGSREETTAWGRRVLREIGQPPEIGFYEIADLAPAPSILRGMVIRSMRKNSPAALHAHFLVVTKDEDSWKRFAGYSKDAPDAAYVVLVTQNGAVRWRTHASDSTAATAELKEHVRSLSTLSR